jgi:hypothetical protein
MSQRGEVANPREGIRISGIPDKKMAGASPAILKVAMAMKGF